MKTAKLKTTIKRSRAAELIDKTPRTLARYEALGILHPIKLNCRCVVYLLSEVQKIQNGEVQAAPDRAATPAAPRGEGGQFLPTVRAN